MPRTRKGPKPYPSSVAVVRDRREMSQADLAVAIAVERPWVSRIEGGQILATPEQLDAICRALDCDRADLYTADLLEVIEKARARA